MELVKQSGSMLPEVGDAFGALGSGLPDNNRQGCSISEITSGKYSTTVLFDYYYYYYFIVLPP